MPVARQHCRRNELECQRSGRSAHSWQVTTLRLGLFRFLPSSSSWLRVTVPASASGPGSGCPAAARRRSESPGLVYFDSDSDPDSAKAGPLARPPHRDWHGAGWQRHRLRACHTGQCAGVHRTVTHGAIMMSRAHIMAHVRLYASGRGRGPDWGRGLRSLGARTGGEGLGVY
jgi:hypothetical protein